MKTQNVAQFKINDRFTLSLSDLGQDSGFEPMLIDNNSKSDIALEREDGKKIDFIELNDKVFKVWNIEDLGAAIKEAKQKANKIIKKELIKENKDLFIK